MRNLAHKLTRHLLTRAVSTHHSLLNDNDVVILQDGQERVCTPFSRETINLSCKVKDYLNHMPFNSIKHNQHSTHATFTFWSHDTGRSNHLTTDQLTMRAELLTRKVKVERWLQLQVD